jgi:hypothetical protein
LNPARHGHGVGSIDLVKDGELITADPCHDRARRSGPGDANGCLAENVVPSGMPTHVVHFLEAVQVQNQDAQRQSVRVEDRPLQRFEQDRTLEKSRETVAIGLPRDESIQLEFQKGDRRLVKGDVIPGV